MQISLFAILISLIKIQIVLESEISLFHILIEISVFEIQRSVFQLEISLF